jgi:outer membrane receptor protein involved in Fe transport
LIGWQQLLVGTGITWSYVNGNTVVLKRAEPKQQAASTEQDESTLRRSSQEFSTTIQEVVVTAQKREERLQDVPISISVLGGQDLDRSSYQGVAEALTTVPGVASFPWGQGGGTLTAVRGVTASYPLFGGSSPIAYYLDGVPFGLVDTAIASTPMLTTCRGWKSCADRKAHYMALAH